MPILDSNERKLYRSETRISGFAFVHLFTAFSLGSFFFLQCAVAADVAAGCIFILSVCFVAHCFRFTFQKESQECGFLSFSS